MNLKRFQRDCLLGALGWFLMLIGDLCLSVIPASQNDISLFTREAYLSGAWEPWRLPLLTVTGLCGMALGFFSVRASVDVILPPYRKTRMAALIGGVMVVATAAAMHFCVGSMADWTTVLAPMIGRDETAMLIAAQFSRLLPAMSVGYVGLALMIGTSFFAVATKKTMLPRWMTALHIVVFQLIFVVIPDIRQTLGMEISTWDYVLSQGSTNAALCIWMLENAAWAALERKKARA